LTEQSLVTVSVPLTSSEGLTQSAKGASTVVCESLEHHVIMPSSANPANHPQRMREEKGKSIAEDDVPNIPVIERFEISLSPDPMVNRAEDETRGNFPREGTKTEQLGMTAVTHSDEMPEVLRAKFLSSMLKEKMFTQKG
jgi:hypothetical protein